MDNMENQSSEQPKKQGHGAMWTFGVIILVVVLGAVVYFGKGNKPDLDVKSDANMQSGMKNDPDNDGDDHGTMAMPSVTPSPTGVMASSTSDSNSMSNEKVFTVSGSNFKFDPSQITVKKGDKVKIVFNNVGGFHDFVIDEFNVKTDRISGGSSATVEFTADKTGSFEYYCSVGEHRAMGMKGTLVVQ